MQTYSFNEKQYELRYSQKRIETIEQVSEKSIMATLASNKGMVSISDLRTYFVYGLKEIEGKYVAPSQGNDYFEELLKETSYQEMLSNVLEVMQRDCPFFFPES